MSIKSGRATSELEFKRVKFSAGEGESLYRWVYEGKIMIRSGDIEKKRKKEKEKDDSVIFSVSVR